ncbi:hypothetical protein ACUXIR_002143, partial [Staphylococcus hominis]
QSILARLLREQDKAEDYRLKLSPKKASQQYVSIVNKEASK